MPKEIKTTVYLYSELTTDKAKEKARQWFIDLTDADDISDAAYEDASQINLKINAWDIYRQTIEGEFINSASETASLILSEHGETCKTYQAAKSFSDAMHNLANVETVPDDLEQQEDDLKSDFLRDILSCYLAMINEQHEYMQSEEYLADTFEANEYTFTEDGKRFG